MNKQTGLSDVIREILRKFPGSNRVDIDNHLSYKDIEYSDEEIDTELKRLLSEGILTISKGKYYHKQDSEPVITGLPNDRIPTLIRIRGKGLWLQSGINLNQLVNELHALNSETITMSATIDSTSFSQLKMKFALVDSSKREIAYSSGTIDSDYFFVLTSVAFTKAIPSFMNESLILRMKNQGVHAEILPLFAISYISLHILERALQNLDEQALLHIDDFSQVAIKGVFG